MGGGRRRAFAESMIRPLRNPQTRGVLFHVHRLIHEKSPMRDINMKLVLSDRQYCKISKSNYWLPRSQPIKLSSILINQLH